MANSVGRFYNATLGDSQFQSDGEHTLFTTNSSTTRIIKEVKFDPQSGVKFTGGYLEVNGHNVANLDASGSALTGEYIVPPNSTVKLKLPNTYPITFYKEYEQFCANSTNRKWYVNTQVRDQTTGTLTNTITQNKSGITLSSGDQSDTIDIVDARGFATRTGSPTNNSGTTYNPYYHMSAITHDSNSVQRIWTFRALNFGEGRSSTPVAVYGHQHQGNYKGFAFDRDINRGQYVNNDGQRVLNTIDNSGSDIGVRGSLNYNENTLQQFTRWNGVANSSPATSQGSFSPQVTSSWPRAHCIGDWYFTIPHSGYNNSVYGVSLKTGQWFQFNLQSSWASSSAHDFTVSIKSDEDKFVFWRPDSTSNINRAISTRTITELEAITSGSTVSETCSYVQKPFPNGNYNNNSFGTCQLSDRMDGGFGYMNTSYTLTMCDFDGNALYDHTQFSGVDTLAANTSGLWKRTMGKMTASEITAAGISQPTFNIQMFGYTAN
jgi:hypothetical protein